MKHEHSFTKQRGGRWRCLPCGMWYSEFMKGGLLPTMDGSDADRESIRQLTEAFDLTAQMRQPGPDISAKSGRMERESPLFFGTGENPLLF